MKKFLYKIKHDGEVYVFQGKDEVLKEIRVSLNEIKSMRNPCGCFCYSVKDYKDLINYIGKLIDIL